jgi:hypothetical protein
MGGEAKGKLGNGVGCHSLHRNMVYPALLPTIRADAHTSAASSRLNWRPADLNGLVRFAERRNLFSARVPLHFNTTSVLFDVHRELLLRVVKLTIHIYTAPKSLMRGVTPPPLHLSGVHRDNFTSTMLQRWMFPEHRQVTELCNENVTSSVESRQLVKTIVSDFKLTS